MELKKTDTFSITYLDVTDVDTSANDIPLVGSWEFTPKDTSYQKDTACFLVTKMYRSLSNSNT